MEFTRKIIFTAVAFFGGWAAWTDLSAIEREHALTSNRGWEFLERMASGLSPIAKNAYRIESRTTELSPEPPLSALTGAPHASFPNERRGLSTNWQDHLAAGSSQALPEAGWEEENMPYVQEPGKNRPDASGQEAGPSLNERSEPPIFDFSVFLGEWVMVWPKNDINTYNWLRIAPGRGDELEYVVFMGRTRFSVDRQGLATPTEEIQGIGAARQEKGLLNLDVSTYDEAMAVRGRFLLNGSQMDGSLTVSQGSQRKSVRVKWARCQVEYVGSPRQWQCY